MRALSLTDGQLQLVLRAADPLDPVLLERVAARLRLTCGNSRPRDVDVADAVERALRGLACEATEPTAA